jgi:hypothetical protein
VLLGMDMPRSTPDRTQFAYNLVARPKSATERNAGEDSTVLTVATPGPLQGLLFPFACDHWHACVAGASRTILRRDGRNLQIESRANTREILLAGAARRGQDTGGRGGPCGFYSPIT